MRRIARAPDVPVKAKFRAQERFASRTKVDRLTRSVAFLSRLLEAGVDVRFADLAAFRERVEMLCHVLDDRGDHEAAAMVGAFGRTLLDPAFKATVELIDTKAQITKLP